MLQLRQIRALRSGMPTRRERKRTSKRRSTKGREKESMVAHRMEKHTGKDLGQHGVEEKTEEKQKAKARAKGSQDMVDAITAGAHISRQTAHS